MVYPAGAGAAIRPAGRTASVRFARCRRLARRGMKRSWPYLKRQHFQGSRPLNWPAGSGSNHHRYGEVKTRLTIDAPQVIEASIRPKRKGPQLALEPLDGRGIAGYVPKP